MALFVYIFCFQRNLLKHLWLDDPSGIRHRLNNAVHIRHCAYLKLLYQNIEVKALTTRHDHYALAFQRLNNHKGI